MGKRIWIYLILFALVGAYAFRSYSIAHKPNNALLSIPAPAGKPFLVFFYSNDCSVCKAMEPSLKNLEKKYGNTVPFVYIDIYDPRNETIVDQFDVEFTPVIRLARKNRSLYKAYVGFVPPSYLENDLKQLL
jgi:thiol-disulfide isomerase/thioredoxin